MNYIHVMKLDANDLLVLNALCDDPHLTRCAAKLNLTQPALSHTLARLRARLGDDLFVRNGRALEPTAYLLSLRPHLNALDNAMLRIASHTQHFDPHSAAHSFTLSLPELVSIPLVPRLMDAVSRFSPDLKFHFVSLDQDSGLQALRDHRVDLFIGMADKGADEFKTQTLYREEFVCVTSRKRRISKDDYLAARHLKLSLQGGNPSYIDRALSDLGIVRHAQVTLPFYLMGFDILRHEDMVMTSPKSMILHMQKQGDHNDLHIAPFPFSVKPLPVAQYWHRRADKDPAHIWLRQLLKTIGDAIAADLGSGNMRARRGA
jgi:DNA-binding transcriptional LysR family regulator